MEEGRTRTTTVVLSLWFLRKMPLEHVALRALSARRSPIATYIITVIFKGRERMNVSHLFVSHLIMYPK